MSDNANSSPPSKQWKLHTIQLSKNRFKHGAIVLPDDRILIMGGWDILRASQSTEVVDIHNNNTATKIPNLVSRRCDHASVVVNNYAYVIGGSSWITSFKSVERININNPTKRWQNIVDLNEARDKCAADIHKGTIFVFGGNSISDGSLATVEYLNTDTSLSGWNIISNRMAIPRRYHCAVTVGDAIYVIGGLDENGNRLNSVEVFDVSSRTFEKGPSLPIPIAETSAVAVGKIIIVVGGKTDGRVIGESYFLDTTISNPIWRMIDIQLQVARSNHTVVLLKNGKLCVCGGVSGTASNANLAIESILIQDFLPTAEKKNESFIPTEGGVKPATQVSHVVHSKEETYCFDAFLTHNWGKDTKNRDNHQRVVQFKNELQKQPGIGNLWLDEERMTGNIVQQMSSGIDQSKFVIVFITQRYMDKVAGRGPNGDKDNCLLEFNYAANKKGASKLIAIVMEDRCSNSNKWDGPIGFFLGTHLYYSFKKDSDLKQCAQDVAAEMKARLKQT